jgi:hypothetical protein
LATAYTPGLTVSPSAVVRRQRRLPIKGDVLVRVGDEVRADTVVARALRPGPIRPVKVAEALGVEPHEIQRFLLKKQGDSVEENEVVAESKSLFGLVTTQARSPYAGTIEFISPLTGHLAVRGASSPLEVNAYLKGRVAELIPDEGVVVETTGAFVQGIFGVGGERVGDLVALANTPDQRAEATDITDSLAGKVVVGGASFSTEAILKAQQVRVAALVAGGVTHQSLRSLLGYDIGVAITGHEDIPTTVIATEGFGVLPMAQATFDLLRSLQGRQASVNGATQIRAGVMRPEVVVPDGQGPPTEAAAEAQTLEVGGCIRLIRAPYFGLLAVVTDLPEQLQEIETGARVRVLRARLDSGQEALVPRANVESIRR